MHIKLFKYDAGLENTTKKESDMTKLYEGDITTFNVVNPLSMWFKISQLYQCNYAIYEYNGKNYWAFVEVSTDAKGLYRYQCNVDALATAWHGGCMQIDNFIAYKQNGSNYIYDSRIKPSEYAREIYYADKIEFTEDDKELKVIMEILQTPWVTNEDGDPLTYSDIGNRTSTSPSFTYYVMTLDGLCKVWSEIKKLSDKDQAKYCPSINGIYAIMNREFDWHYGLKPVNNIYLESFNGQIMGDIGTISIDVTNEEVWLLDKNAIYGYDDGKEVLCLKFEEEGGVFGGIEIKNDLIKSKCVFTMYNGYQFCFNPSEVIRFWDEEQSIHEIYSLGYAASLNLSGHSIRYTLLVNEQPINYMYMDIKLNNLIPFAYDSSISRYTDYLSSVISIGTGILQVGTGIGATIGTGGAGAAIGTAQTISGISNIANGLQGAYNTSLQQETGSYTTIDGFGWDRKNTVYDPLCSLSILYYPQIDRANFNAKYGLPSNTVETLSSLGTGYAQTQACKLLLKGFPKQVIDNAELICNGGFYIS